MDMTNELYQLARCLLHMRKSNYLKEINSSLKRQEYILTAILSYNMLISEDIQRLTHMYLNSAMENLRFAQNTSSEVQINYILQAKNRFIDASVIERNENLILSYLGLALCQAIMGEDNNVILTLQSIENLKYADEEMEWDSLDDKKRMLISVMYYKNKNVDLSGGFSGGLFAAKILQPQLGLYIKTMPAIKAECSVIYNKIREEEFNSLRNSVITNFLKNEDL